MSAPEGYFGELVAGVKTIDRERTVEGYVLAFGATVGRCYAAVFTTRAQGPGSELVIGRTLAVIVAGVLQRISTRSVEDRSTRPDFPF